MSTQEAPRTDRRHLRRAETIEQVLSLALDVMAEQGVAGLSLGEVARRLGVRTPSLYTYFDSKHALYDALFARGWHEVLEAQERLPEPDETTDLPGHALEMARTYLRWTHENPVLAALMSWRPVPGYEPSPAAYAPAVVSLDRLRERLLRLQDLGLFDAEVDVDELVRAWTVLVAGVMTQQLANAPEEDFDRGRFTTMLPALVAMLLAHYAPKT